MEERFRGQRVFDVKNAGEPVSAAPESGCIVQKALFTEAVNLISAGMRLPARQSFAM
jgi:hypothetical protein